MAKDMDVQTEWPGPCGQTGVQAGMCLYNLL